MKGKSLIGPVLLLFLTLFYTPSVFSHSSVSPEITINPKDIRVEHTDIIVRNIEHEITLQFRSEEFREVYEGKKISLQVNGQPVPVEITKGNATFSRKFTKETDFTINYQDFEYQTHINPIPLWFSIIPPLVAILFALIFKEVYSALFIGILLGTTTIYAHQGAGIFSAFFKGIFAIPDTYVLQSLGNEEHLSIIVFSMLIGGMVGIITKNGGMKGVVKILSKYAKSARSGQFVTWLLGMAIFFDDYANTLVVGNTMRPVTDRLKISREKLAYIVDSTAAPIAAIAFVTTWIGAELSYIQDGINTLGLDQSPYNVFINSLAYSFYPIFALIFILMLTYKGRDFGPMFRAEQRARTGKIIRDDEKNNNSQENEIDIPEHIKPRAYNAVIPVAIVIFGTFIGLLYTGWDPQIWGDPELTFSKKISVIIGNSDSFKALLWSSILGVIIALVLTITKKLLNLKKA
ncbi:MAG: Na+/H+ antiporter NhaC family protein, partial [Bacteroidales bacterium]